jgi:hypothetical protein
MKEADTLRHRPNSALRNVCLPGPRPANDATRGKQIPFPKSLFSALSLVLTILPQAMAQTVEFDYNANRVAAIRVGGINVLTGGGIYGICSQTGSDNPDTNWGTGQGFGGYMYNPRQTSRGPQYRLSFGQRGNTLDFSFLQWNYPTSIAITSFAVDMHKRAVGNWAFSGNRYRWLHTSRDNGRWFNGNANTYASIPPLTTSWGWVGLAAPEGKPSWLEARGTVATIRMNLGTTDKFDKSAFYNHSGTNNLEVDFKRMDPGQGVGVAGSIVVTPNATRYIRFESESADFGHQTGSAQGDGWVVTTKNPASTFASFGPYTSGHSGNRTAGFRLMIDNNTVDNTSLLRLDVSSGGSILAQRTITRRQFTRAGQYQDFDLGFTARPDQMLEFRTYLLRAAATVKQDSVTLK